MASHQKSIGTGEMKCSIQDLFIHCWEKGTLPQDLRDAVIISPYKTREKNQTVHTIEASLYSPLQAKSWLASC